MIFKKFTSLLLVGAATASAIFTNGTTPGVISNVVSGTTTLAPAPNYSVAPITTTYSYTDSMTTFYVTNTIYQTIWFDSSSTLPSATSVASQDATIVEKNMGVAKSTPVASTTSLPNAIQTSSSTLKSGSTLITSAPIAKSSFGYLNSTIADDDTTTSTSTSYIYTTLTKSVPPSGSCVPKIQYVTVTAKPATEFVTVTQSIATSLVTVTAQPSFYNSANYNTTATHSLNGLNSTNSTSF